MKTIKYIYLGLFSLTFICLSSCELTGDLDDESIEFSLDAETAINDENSANLALAGAYAGLTSQGIGTVDHLAAIPSSLAGGVQQGSFANLEEPTYAINDPLTTETQSNRNSYATLYQVINKANWIIEKVEELSDGDFEAPNRRMEMIAEAKGIRATAHLYVLRLWGQFYDMNSEYGITVRTSPVRSADAFPRNTVAETYAAIIADLDDVIASAPDFRQRYYVNKTYGKGLKARVLLYQGDYAGAAALAKDVIDNAPSDFGLSANYTSIFDHSSAAIYSNTDIIFGSRIDAAAGASGSFFYTWEFYYGLTPVTATLATASTTIGTQSILHDSDRISSQQAMGFYGLKNLKWANDNTTLNHLRISEMYLVLAEASARASNSVTTEALDALNAIRIRAGATTTGSNGFETYPATITYEAFLEAVRIEKYIELFGEIGEEWFDMVRYDYADGFGSGFQVSDIKATATNSDKFILPIDELNIQGGGNVVVQNPGYN
ncbi:RagB/SusD family nutrient uptake outer membrane protein [Seonamhaeicola maritimus]|uniref:RagB/SusD family nutrient uptake outer membrane protein n=1 Tax=Seonamhaeicola maritimus TaxID=2591822 RepID=UPI0024941910|nr:RagB/SusD family nutrient uptake outer membrane protein [Seonamhaeicola maritimus]